MAATARRWAPYAGAVAAVLLAAFAWASSQSQRTTALEAGQQSQDQRIQRLEDEAKNERDAQSQLMREIVQRLARIEGKLDRR